MTWVVDETNENAEGDVNNAVDDNEDGDANINDDCETNGFTVKILIVSAVPLFRLIKAFS